MAEVTTQLGPADREAAATSATVTGDAGLKLALEALERAERRRACELVAVLGGDDHGRDRLARRLTAAVGDRASVLSARCAPVDAGTFWPLVMLLATLPRPLEDIVAGEPHADLVAERLASGRVEEHRWAARRLLEALARERPLLVLLDDLQLAKPIFLDLVEYLADRSHCSPILLVCLGRSELLQARPGWATRRTTALLADERGGGAAEAALDPLHPGVASALDAEGHERAAAALAQAPAPYPGAYDELVGYHLEQAWRLRRALGQDDAHTATLGRQAAASLAAAGRRAYGRYDLQGMAASDLLGRAVALFGAQASVEYRELLPELVAALAEVAAVDRAREAIAAGLHVAAAADDRRLEARLRIEDAWLTFHVDPATDLVAAVGRIEAALAVLQALGDDRGMARACYALGSCVFSQGRAEAAMTILQRAVRHARRAGDRRVEVDAVWQLAGPLFWGPTPAEEAIGRTHELLGQVPPVSQPEAFLLVMEATLTAMRGQLDQARTLFRRGLARYDELGVAAAEVGLPQYSSRLQFLAGEVEAAVAELEDHCRASQRRGDLGYLATTAGLLSEGLYRLGRHDEALEAAALCQRCAAADDFGAQILWRSVRGKLLARRGDHDRAEQLAREAVAIGEPTDHLFVRGDALLDLAEVLDVAGRRSAARQAADAAYELYSAKGDLVSAARAAGRR
jgi:tetratricopeptide (TPR) repeat protein